MQINLTNKNISLNTKSQILFVFISIKHNFAHVLCFVPEKLQKGDSLTANNPAELHLLPWFLHEIRSSC